MSERTRVNVKVERGSAFRCTRDPPYNRDSLLLWRFVFRMAEASAKRVTGDEPQGTMGMKRETSGYEADLAPQYLTSKFTKRSNIHTRNTRTWNSLQIPLYRTAIGQCTFLESASPSSSFDCFRFLNKYLDTWFVFVYINPLSFAVGIMFYLDGPVIFRCKT